VFAANLQAAVALLLQPDRHAAAFELGGEAGAAMIRGLGVLFLMWNATYPPVILRPHTHRLLFAIILAQQAIGIAGEAWIWASLSPAHGPLRTTGLRFLIFDGLGLLAMAGAFWGLARAGGGEAGRA
jgi:hypothetical protein